MKVFITSIKKWQPGLIVIVLAYLITGCGGGSDETSPEIVPPPPVFEPFSYAEPEAKADGWDTADAQAMGLDVSLLETLMDNINRQQNGFRHMDGVVLIRQNKLLFDTLIRRTTDKTDGWIGNNNLALHAQHSVTKSWMSAAMGIAIEQGLVGGVDDLALSYFADYAPFANDSATKQGMTLDNWLTMRHGFEWDEWDVGYLDPRNQNKQMVDSSTPLRFLFDLPMQYQPGSRFTYSTGVSYALGRIITRTSGTTLYRYMQRNLFEPLGITQYDTWLTQGDMHAGSSLYLTMRDMAKFGQMFLDGGVWQGQQVVPLSWVQESTREHVNDGTFRYGYQWWLTTFRVGTIDYDCFYANGWGGQFIMIFPELDSVVVLTGRRYEDGMEQETDVRMMLRHYILPFLLSEGS